MSDQHSPVGQIFIGVTISVISAFLVWKLGFQDHTKTEDSSTNNSKPFKEMQRDLTVTPKSKTSLYVSNNSHVFLGDGLQMILKVGGQITAIENVNLNIYDKPDFEFDSGGSMSYEIQLIGIHDDEYYNNTYYGNIYLAEGTKNKYTLNSVKTFKGMKEIREPKAPNLKYEIKQYIVHKLFLSKE